MAVVAHIMHQQRRRRPVAFISLSGHLSRFEEVNRKIRFPGPRTDFVRQMVCNGSAIRGLMGEVTSMCFQPGDILSGGVDLLLSARSLSLNPLHMHDRATVLKKHCVTQQSPRAGETGMRSRDRPRVLETGVTLVITHWSNIP